MCVRILLLEHLICSNRVEEEPAGTSYVGTVVPVGGGPARGRRSFLSLPRGPLPRRYFTFTDADKK